MPGIMHPTDNSILDEKELEEEPVRSGREDEPDQDDDEEEVEEEEDGSSTATTRTSYTSSSPFSSSLCLPLLQLENEQGGVPTQHGHINTTITNNNKNRKLFKRMSSSFISGDVHRAITNIEAVLDRELFINSVGGGTTAPHEQPQHQQEQYQQSSQYACNNNKSNTENHQDDDDIDSICSDLRQLDSWEENVREELERAEDEWRLEKRRMHSIITHNTNHSNRVVTNISGHGGGSISENESKSNDLHHHHHHTHVVVTAREDTETELSTDYEEEEDNVQDFMTKSPPPATSQASIISMCEEFESLAAMSTCSSLASLADFSPENNMDSTVIAAAAAATLTLPNNSMLMGTRTGSTTGVLVQQQQTQQAGMSGVSVTMAYDVLSSQVLHDHRSILSNWLHRKMHWRNVLLASGGGGGDCTHKHNNMPTQSIPHTPMSTPHNIGYYSPFSSLVVPRAATTTSEFAAATNAHARITHPSSRGYYSKNSWKIGVPVFGSATVSSDGQLRMLLICGGGLDTTSRNDCIALALRVCNDDDDDDENKNEQSFQQGRDHDDPVQVVATSPLSCTMIQDVDENDNGDWREQT